MKLMIENLNQQAYDVLKNKIICKELKPGDRLVDSQLAEEFGISRTPIRDAIRKLTDEGLVMRSNGSKGYQVYRPDATDINEIFELRQILDIAAVTKLITEIIPSNPEVLEELKSSYIRVSSPDSASSFVLDDEDFHGTIIRLSNNSRMQSVYSDLRIQTRAFRSVTSHSAGRMKKAENYHAKIYNGIISGDLDATIEAIKTHIFYSKRDALKDYTN